MVGGHPAGLGIRIARGAPSRRRVGVVVAERRASAIPVAPWIAALLLLMPSLSILFGVSASGSAAAPAAAPSPSPSAAPKPETLADVPGFVWVLADFLGIDPRELTVARIVGEGEAIDPSRLKGRLEAVRKDVEACTAGSPAGALEVLAFGYLWHEVKTRGYRVGHLIVTIPDPDRSQLSLNFDRNLDAIQRAMGAGGFVLDRFDLPWQQDQGDVGVTRDKRASRSHTEPGLLLFRRVGGEREILVVFLVGETPTGGVQKLALLKALELVYAGEGPAGSPRQVRASPHGERVGFRILGPSFTGAAPSLASTLSTWRQCRPNASFRIVTGSATAIDRDFLDGLGDHNTDDSFAATINLDQPWRVPKVLDVPPTEVALVTESNTGFGSQLGRRLAALRGRDEMRSLNLTFPLAISRVRSAYEKQRRSRAPASDQDSQRALPLFLDEASDSSDVPNPYSSLSTHSTELVLSQLLDAIAREDVRYVVLLATDVRDTLFLAREVRTHCPNASLVTTEADVLLLHPDVIRWTEGMLVLTPYPLAGLTQALSDPGRHRTRFQFPSSTTQGVYNAALSFVEPGGLLDYAPPPLEDVSPGDEPASLDPATPPLWLAVVSRSGFVPLRYLPDPGSRSYVRDRPPAAQGRPASLGSFIQSEGRIAFSFVVFLVTACIPAMFLLVHWPLTRPFRSRWACDVFGDVIGAPIAERRLYQMGFVLSLASFGLVAAMVYLTPLWLAGGSGVVWELRTSERVFIFASAAVFAAAAALALGRALGPGSGASHWAPRFLAYVAVAGAAAGLVAWAEYPLDGVVSHKVVAVFAGGALPLCFLDGLPWRALAHGRSRLEGLLRRVLPHGLSRLEGLFRPVLAHMPSWLNRLVRPADSELGTIGPILVTMCLTAVLSIAYGFDLYRQPPFEAFTYYVRATDPASGVTPLVPLFLVQLCAGLWALGSLTRLRLYERLRGPRLLDLAGPSSHGLERLETELVATVGAGTSKLPFSLLGLSLIAVASYRLLWNRTLAPPYEPSSFNWLFSVAFFFVYFGIVVLFVRFVNVWVAFSRLLRAVALFPFADALRAFQTRLSWTRFMDPTGPVPELVAANVALQRADTIQGDLDALAKAIGGTPPYLGSLGRHLSNAHAAFKQALVDAAAGDRPAATFQQKACDVALGKVARRVGWALDRVNVPPGADDATRKIVATWRSNAEQLMAARIAGLAMLIISVLRALITAVSISVLLMLLAVSSYPFQNKELLLTFNWSVILTVVSGTLWVFIQMDRDEVLSYLAGSDPGKLNLNRDFLLRILTYGAVPLLTMLAMQFPGAGMQMSAWIQRLLGAAH
jgi:hypothetical protein